MCIEEKIGFEYILNDKIIKVTLVTLDRVYNVYDNVDCYFHSSPQKPKEWGEESLHLCRVEHYNLLKK